VGWMLDRIRQRCDELAGQAEHLGKQLVDIELELADLIAAERVVGRASWPSRARGPAAFTLLTNWSFSPFREASEAARTVASRSRRSR
jgi:hypothetical protein